MHFEGSEGDERECEDHDGFFEPWSHRKLEIFPTNGLEITVGFLAVKNSNIPGIVALTVPSVSLVPRPSFNVAHCNIEKLGGARG